MISGDLFERKKSVHIKLSKEAHFAIRVESFKRKLSIQLIFNEFATMVANGDKAALRILDIISKKKLSGELKRIARKEVSNFGNIDGDALYDLINASMQDEQDEDD